MITTNGRVYVSYDYLEDTPYMFSCTMKDHSPNMMFINSAKKYGCWKNFVEHYNLGLVFYESQKIKNVCNELIKLMIVRR